MLAKRNKFKSALGGWLIMLPTLILFAFFVWVPLIESVRMSLFSARGYELIEFVGLANYRSVFANPHFIIAWQNTFVYIFWSLIIGFCVPIIMAILITESPFLKGLTRTVVYFPNVLPGLAIVIIWMFFFRPGDTGVLNIVLGWVGIDPFTWLTARGWTIPLIVVTMTWRSAGATALIYMAGISGISPELVEAATIDGARPLSRIRYVILPNLGNLVKSMFILQILAVFQILFEPLMMTNGGPNNASLSVMMLVFNYAFDQFDYPRAAAVSVLICIVLTVITAIYFAVTKKLKADKG
jgi:multiple sugar transport system permease protein